jgi:hypothetical protein
MTIAQEIAALPDAPFDVFEVVFGDAGPYMVRGRCVAKDKTRVHIDWPNGESEKLKPSQIDLNPDAAYARAAEEVINWGQRMFFRQSSLEAAKSRVRSHQKIADVIRMAVKWRSRQRREEKARAEIDAILYGIEPGPK